MSDTISALVSQILSNLQDGQNPWELIREAFARQVRPVLEDSFLSQLWATSALLGLSLILMLLCLVVKIKQGSYWVFRTYRGTGGRFIVVHYSSAFLTFMIAFFILLIVYVWQTARYAEGHLVEDTALWRTLTWIPGVFAFWFSAWSLVCSHILHLDSSGRPARTWFASAFFVNSVGIFMPAALAVSVGILASVAHKHYHTAMDNYGVIDGSLSALSASYNGTFDSSLFSSGIGLTLAEEFTTDLEEFGTWFRWTFVAYLTFSCILLILLVISATMHLRELRKTMDDLRNRSQLDDDVRNQEQSLEAAYRGLVYVTWSIIAACVAIVAIFLFVSVAGRKVVYDATISKVASLLPIWIFSVFGPTLSLSFLVRLLRNSSSAPPKSLRKSNKSEEAFDAVKIPTTAGPDTLSSPSIMEGKGAHGGDEYPMTSLGAVSYHPSGQYSIDSTDHRLSPSSNFGSEAHLVHHNPVVTTSEVPFHATPYETRQPAQEVEEIYTGGRKKGWRG
ncbi:hypothetical protein JCM8547_005722 [Rhodosporidiobolus lusitaniae]